jgi:hypothetical protein
MFIESRFVPDSTDYEIVEYGLAFPGHSEGYKVTSVEVGQEEKSEIIIIHVNGDWASADVYAIEAGREEPENGILAPTEDDFVGKITYNEPFVRKVINKDRIKGRLVMMNTGFTPN